MATIIVSEQKFVGPIADKLFESLSGPAVQSFLSIDHKKAKVLASFTDKGTRVEISCVQEDRACLIKETRDEPDEI